MSIKYQIWFTWNAEREKIRLPVLPEKFSSPSISILQTHQLWKVSIFNFFL